MAGTRPGSVSARTLNLGLRTSLEGFHAQIILEMASRALVTDVFLLLSFYLFRSLPFPSPFGSSAGCSRGLRVYLPPSASAPLRAAARSSLVCLSWNLLLWTSHAGVPKGSLLVCLFVLIYIFTPFCLCGGIFELLLNPLSIP